MKYSKYIWLILAAICFTGAFSHIGHFFIALFCVLMYLVIGYQDKTDKEWEDNYNNRTAR